MLPRYNKTAILEDINEGLPESGKPEHRKVRYLKAKHFLENAEHYIKRAFSSIG